MRDTELSAIQDLPWIGWLFDESNGQRSAGIGAELLLAWAARRGVTLRAHAPTSLGACGAVERGARVPVGEQTASFFWAASSTATTSSSFIELTVVWSTRRPRSAT